MAKRSSIARDEFWRLFDVAHSRGGGTLHGYLQKVLDGCVHLFGASGASVFVREGHSGLYRLAARSGADAKAPLGALIQPGIGIAGACIESGRPLLVDDPLQHPLLKGKVSQKRRDVRSSIVLPLITPSQECVGVMNLSRGPDVEPYAESDMEAAASLAKHAALAVSNALLLAEKDSAAREANDAKDKLQALFACLGAGVVSIDESGNATDCNPEAEKIGALNPDAPIYEALFSALRESAAGKRHERYFHDGETNRSFQIVCAPLSGGGATATIHEVTDLERTQKELSRLRRLAEIGQMTAAIAHEIKNPLTGISSAAQMLCAYDGISKEFGSMIKEDADKLNDLCNSFLDFARPLAIREESVEVNELFAKVAGRHRAEAVQRGVTVRVSGEKLLLKGDSARLEQVAHNLVLNAIQACRPGDSVHICVTDKGFSVADTGQGMTQDQMGKLFTPFFTTKPNGTGLGLSNVRKIIDAHEGEIRVKSQAGQGTVFEVEFDRRRIA